MVYRQKKSKNRQWHARPPPPSWQMPLKNSIFGNPSLKENSRKQNKKQTAGNDIPHPSLFWIIIHLNLHHIFGESWSSLALSLNINFHELRT